MGNQRAPDLCLYPVFRFRVEEVQLEVLLQLFECQFYCPPVFVNQSDFFGRYLPVVGDELVLPAFFVLIVDKPETERFGFLFTLVVQMDVLHSENAGFLLSEHFFKDNFLQLGFGVVFQPADEVDTLVRPVCELAIGIVRLVEDQHAASRRIQVGQENFLSCIFASLMVAETAVSAWMSVGMWTFSPPFFLPSSLGLRPAPFMMSENSVTVVESKA